MKKTIDEINAALESRKDRSAWGKGVTLYAFDLLDNIRESLEYNGLPLELDAAESSAKIDKWMLNGASDWTAFSWGGSSLIYNGDIAERLCNNTELKRTKNGANPPNCREEWLDVQARALYQAANLIKRIIRG